jgi:acyl carrier protein
LELAVALHTEFGVRTKPDDERNREIFHSVKSLAEFIRTERAKATNAGGETPAAPPDA